MANALKRVKNAKLLLIPASEQTSGHLTTGNAKFYKDDIGKLLNHAPKRAM
jgi:homoserine O-acetyltransferase/O-succinyltransferase